MGISDRDLWIALVIGNSRWHWGAFEGDRWLGSWHTLHLTEAQTLCAPSLAAVRS